MLELARELGLALADSDEFKNLVCARRNVQEDRMLQKQLDDFKRKREEVIHLMETGGEEIVSVSNDLEVLQRQLFENPLFVDLLNAENDFQAVLGSVNEEIARCISDADPTGETEFLSSGCGCGGCSH